MRTGRNALRSAGIDARNGALGRRFRHRVDLLSSGILPTRSRFSKSIVRPWRVSGGGRCRDQPAHKLSHRDEHGRVVFQTRRGGDMDITQPAAQFVKDRLPVGIEDIVGDGHLPLT